MGLFKDLLFNLIFILITTLACQLFVIDRLRYVLTKNCKWLVTCIAGFQILFCIAFSYRETNGFIFDLRLIPVILGGFYGGPITSLLLFIIVLLTRLPFGGNGIWVTFFCTAGITLIVCFLHKLYQSQNTRKKLFIATSLATAYSLSVFILKNILTDQPINMAYAWIYTGTLIASMLIVTYLIEIVRQNEILREAVLKSEKSEVVSQLAASLSHEVRNPLTVTRGFLQMLKDPMLDQGKKSFYLDTAIEELDRAELIIKEYLSFSKPQTENTSTFCIRMEIVKALELLKPYANNFSVKIQTVLDGDLVIMGEASKFQQCLLNIIKNSIEAMPNGGNICIRAIESGAFASVHIKDTGIGMTPAQISRLGEPYFSTKQDKGTGLGMVVVYKVIQEMGGSIETKSALQKGTEFTLRLPLGKWRSGQFRHN
ncbi:ATP-binding protein [Bacillus massilinigeriensis]|uniref:ATP-binding protein n=1 Tax=Bacillus mediterraneensis TaxID=1805474 RepID=UPI0008F9050C|nr:sensor histidine kinase [Bacillus mediterraneensis]